jgi:hypothetical protein
MMSFIEFIRPSARLALIDEQTMAITIACDVIRVKQATVAALHTMDTFIVHHGHDECA